MIEQQHALFVVGRDLMWFLIWVIPLALSSEMMDQQKSEGPLPPFFFISYVLVTACAFGIGMNS